MRPGLMPPALAQVEGESTVVFGAGGNEWGKLICSM